MQAVPVAHPCRTVLLTIFEYSVSHLALRAVQDEIRRHRTHISRKGDVVSFYFSSSRLGKDQFISSRVLEKCVIGDGVRLWRINLHFLQVRSRFHSNPHLSRRQSSVGEVHSGVPDGTVPAVIEIHYSLQNAVLSRRHVVCECYLSSVLGESVRIRIQAAVPGV